VFLRKLTLEIFNCRQDEGQESVFQELANDLTTITETENLVEQALEYARKDEEFPNSQINHNREQELDDINEE
jgi:hypothetical protein